MAAQSGDALDSRPHRDVPAVNPNGWGAVLEGNRLRTDAEVVHFPDRYMDGRGQRMWDTALSIADKLESQPEPV